ncbi:MAG: DUF305 domain-containing protein [Armatimonadetes bacterium]|nr:DUF305 domain-containing protein [Armatimonadota bacterium]
MRKITIIFATLSVLMVAGVVWANGQDAHHPPAAQPQQQTPAQAPQPPTGAGPDAEMGGMSMMQMMQMMQSMHPAIAVDETAIYIVRGNEVFKLDKSLLRVVSRATLPAMEMQAMPGPMGRGPGMQEMMQRPGMQDMMGRMRQMPADQFDREFMQNMMRHHAGAITISKLAAEKAKRPELRRFAQQVVDDQTRENQQLSRWLQGWYDVTAQAAPMPMDEEMLERLRALEGKQFDTEYMQAMVTHHQEAVNMARIAEQRAARPELKALAAQIVKEQSAEMEQLRGWLAM